MDLNYFTFWSHNHKTCLSPHDPAKAGAKVSLSSDPAKQQRTETWWVPLLRVNTTPLPNSSIGALNPPKLADIEQPETQEPCKWADRTIRTPFPLSIAPSSTQTQLKRKSTHQNICCCQHQQPHDFTCSELGWGQGPLHPGGQRWPGNTTLFQKEGARAGCLYQESRGSEPRAEPIPSCVCSSWGHPGCTALMLLAATHSS